MATEKRSMQTDAQIQTPATRPAVDTSFTFQASRLDAKIPEGPIQEKWDKHRFELKLVNPANKRRYTIIMVGSGLAGASAGASLAELG